MSVHVICIASGSGIPIFSRKRGNVENFPFSVIGSLNGVHMFIKSQSITLLNTLTDNYCVVWKEYFESGCTEDAMERLLLSVFNAIVLTLGINEVRTLKNVEKIKRELRVIYPVIDRLLDSLDCGDSYSKNCSDLISLAEVILCNENHQMKIVLDTYTECISSVYTCILIHGKIAVATEEWWDLHPEELKLLVYLANSDIKSNIKDVPVFLPYKSPNTCYRLITCSPISDMHICCLASQQHSLNDIERSAINCFKTNLEVLNSAMQCFPRNIPESLQLDLGILGLLLINENRGKYVISSIPSSADKKRICSNSHRLDILRTFFYRSVLKFLHSKNNLNEHVKRECFLNDETDSSLDKKEIKSDQNYVSTVGIETYWCSEYHKCYAIAVEENILCMMYNSTVPTYAMKHIAKKVLKTITCDKQLCW